MQTTNLQAGPPARQKLLNAAQELMLSQGFTATSVDEICDAAELTKGSFFHYFSGKEDLGKRAARQFYKSWRQAYASAPFRRKKDPLDRVFGHVDFFVEMSRLPTWKGCLLGTFIQELSYTHPQIREVCAECLDDLAESFQCDLKEAKAKYVPSARWSAKSLAEQLIVVAQGAIILAKARQDPKVFQESLAHFKQYLKSLFATNPA
jgi:TetR/AcrR family transcriptional repressor of nem operon